jgi:hypothetical protein
MTPREAVYAVVRSWLSDEVADLAEETEQTFPYWTRSDNERLRKKLPIFHDKWTSEFTDGLIETLDRTDMPLREAVYKYVRAGIIEGNLDDDTPEDIEKNRADADAESERWTDGIMTALVESGYEVQS